MGIYQTTTFAYDWRLPQLSDKDDGKITTSVSRYEMYNFPTMKGVRNE